MGKGERAMERGASILLTGGGTGGHLAIVAAVKEALNRRGLKPCYIGSMRGQDRAWFEHDTGFEQRLFLPTKGVVNQKGVAKAASLLQMIRQMRRARRFMQEHRIQTVLSVGGFSAAPASFAAVTGRIPLFIHEQNAVSGRLNRLLKPFAHTFYSSYAGTRIDYPVRDLFFETARVRTGLRRVIFLGGSQGARAVNDFALTVASKLHERGVAIVHQTGANEYERVMRAYEAKGIDAEVFAFDKALHEKIASADLAVSRAGASTLWELVANQIPALFIPYPYAAGDHQYFNAKFLSDRGAGWVRRESELSAEDLLGIDDRALEAVSRRLEGMIAPGGADAIALSLMEAAGL